MKTIERAHTPLKQWERIKLSQQYTKALEQIEQRLIYWPNFLIHKCKQRLTRLTQVAIASRKLALKSKDEERRVVGVKSKVVRRETTRERKALAAARVEKAIEKELLDRLKSGAYGDKPLNVDEKVWQTIMNNMRNSAEGEADEDVDDEAEEEEESEGEAEVEYVEDDDDADDDGDLVELDDIENWLGADVASGEEFSDSDSSIEEDSEDEDDTEKAAATKRKRPSSSSKPRKRMFSVYIYFILSLLKSDPF